MQQSADLGGAAEGNCFYRPSIYTEQTTPAITFTLIKQTVVLYRVLLLPGPARTANQAQALLTQTGCNGYSVLFMHSLAHPEEIV